jgi:aminoglycoside/choline kinase family phosphotransferase
VASAGSAIGAWNEIKDENRAFLYFSRQFRNAGLHVPEIYQEDPENDVYLMEDLGDISMLSLVDHAVNTGAFPDAIRDLYRQTLKELIGFQVTAGKNLDYTYCYPRGEFDERSMYWDLNYFKYYFLKLHVPFHEEMLEDDFVMLVSYLKQAEVTGFMYRDFQARNILIRDGQPYFIDYQGGRKGPLHYDVASLLFQVKAGLPPAFREEMLQYYIEELSRHISYDHASFRKYYAGFTLIRILQVLGAYGFRGLIEKKPHFKLSIPGALANLEWWLANAEIDVQLPELMRCLDMLTHLEDYRKIQSEEEGRLTVSISSFSYKNSIPDDRTGYGGGFVFDCRALPNPGREERYRAFTGKDPIIIQYLEDRPEVEEFLENAGKLVSQSVDNYLERGFDRLSVQFGCTGGQHRSVYCVEKLGSFLRDKYPGIVVKVDHTMIINR